MKTKLILSFIFIVTLAYSQTITDTLYKKDTISPLKEIISFTSKYNKHKVLKKYAVYVIHLYDTDREGMAYSFTMGLIINEFDYNFIRCSHYFELDSNMIVVGFSKMPEKNMFDTFDLKPINKIDKQKITSKLYPSKKGGFTGTMGGMTYTQKDGKITTKMYENDGNIPRDISIYSIMPIGDQRKYDNKFDLLGQEILWNTLRLVNLYLWNKRNQLSQKEIIY